MPNEHKHTYSIYSGVYVHLSARGVEVPGTITYESYESKVYFFIFGCLGSSETALGWQDT